MCLDQEYSSSNFCLLVVISGNGATVAHRLVLGIQREEHRAVRAERDFWRWLCIFQNIPGFVLVSPSSLGSLLVALLQK